MKKNIIILICFILITPIVTSQEKNTQLYINDFAKSTQAKITINKNLKIPGFIKFPINKPLLVSGESVEEKANNFLSQNKSMYAIDNINDSLIDGTTKIDNYGLKHFTLKQNYKGIPVFDSQMRFHFDKNDNLKSINGNIIPDININPVPKLSKSEARTIALSLIENQNLNYSGHPLKVITNDLYIFPKGLIHGHVTSKHLVYRIEVRNDVDVREYVFIDAHTGKLVEQFTGIAHALNRSVYEVDLSNKKYSEGDNTNFLKKAYKNEVATAGHFYYLFFNTFGVDSYDNADAEMVTINNDANIDCPNSPNAFWNGTNTAFCDGTAADDIIAHEWGHAYDDYSSRLIYQYESGAINEAYSDIWGETIDILNNYEDDGEDLSVRTGGNVTLRWQVGEDASSFGSPIRDMWNPNLKGDPGKMTDSEYNCDVAMNDQGGVHTNSGIPNHAYSLLVDGDIYNGQAIAGLGFTKAAHIFWRAQSEYLTRSSDFSVLADALEAACADLVGINLQGLSTTATPAGPSGEIITVGDCAEVAKAILAVEMRTDNGCPYPTLLAAGPALCGAADSNPIFYEDWESGLGAWSISQLPENASTWESRDWVLETNLPENRTGQAVFAVNPANGDCQIDLQHGILRLESPMITIPNYSSGNFELAFNHNVSTETNFDGGNIKYSLDGGAWTVLPGSAFTTNPYNLTLDNTANNDNPMKGEEAFSGSDTGSFDSVWGQSIIDLTSIGVVANSTLQLRWELGSDGCYGLIGWYVDEIVVYNCDNALSINDFNFLGNNISIFPNPSNGIFNIKMKSISNFKYNIYDITGKEMMPKTEVTNNTFKLDLSTYSQGIYFFKLYSNEGAITQKLIVQ